MATDSETFNKDLYDLLKVRGYDPVPLDSRNQRVPASQTADVIQFAFTKDGVDYGKAWITIDDTQNVVVYYDDEQQQSPSSPTPGVDYDDSWTGFLTNLKQWAQRRQLSFELSNKDHLGDDMRQREYYKMKEKLGESYHAMGKKASYNDAVPNVKIVLQHNRALEEGEARFRNVAKIYLENADGERFLAPTNKPGIARVYARHIAEGGLPNDERWNHIKTVCEDYSKMAGFVRATRNGQFNESAAQLVEEGINHYNSLRENLHKLTTHRGYQAYFESWTPTLMEGDGEDISEMFMSSSMDPRIEAAMPILSRLQAPINEMSEVDSLSEWADDVINEKLELDEMDKEHGSKRDFDNARGPDKTGSPVKVKDFAKSALKSLNRAMKGWEKGVHDVDTVKAATKSLSPDQKEKALSAKVGKGSPAELQQKLIKREKNKQVNEGAGAPTFKRIDDYSDWHDDYVMRMGAEYDETDLEGQLLGIAQTSAGVRGIWYNKQKFGTISSTPFEDEVEYIETDPNSPWLNEGLDANQKRVGQLGPTEKVKNNNIGKLVGASESTEIDPELARIIEMARFKR